METYMLQLYWLNTIYLANQECRFPECKQLIAPCLKPSGKLSQTKGQDTIMCLIHCYVLHL